MLIFNSKLLKLFCILNFGYCNLFVICNFGFGALKIKN